jgi:hypothetical protein
MKTNRLSGHELEHEGAPFRGDGRKIRAGWGGTGSIGHGKCSCGALSPELTSGTQRKAWHRAHKDEIRAARA